MEQRGLFILYSQYQGCWWPGNTRKQGISSHNIDIIMLEFSVSTPEGLMRELDCQNTINSLGPSDAIWRCRSGSTLAQVMACCLWHQAITWTNVVLSSVRSIDIHMRTTWPWTPQPSITNITLKITSKFSFKSSSVQWVKLAMFSYGDWYYAWKIVHIIFISNAWKVQKCKKF